MKQAENRASIVILCEASFENENEMEEASQTLLQATN